MSRQNLFTIAPHARFLPTLADRIIDGTLFPDWPRSGPFWLTDITIILPTRRSGVTLAAAFAERGHSLLPDIRTFGGEASDEEPFLPPIELPVLPNPVGALERKLVLAHLIEQWAQTPAGQEIMAYPPNSAEVLALADSLAELIDDLEIANVHPTSLRGLAQEKELASNWEQTLKFLDIALAAWPHILGDRGKADATAIRNLRLLRQAEATPLIYGERPVVAAGSTGSMPATAKLLQAVADLPRGAIVLPGLDTSLTTEEVEALRDLEKAPHGHPQFGMVQLLRQLGSTPEHVTELADKPEAVCSIVVRKALALPDLTCNWQVERARLSEQQIAGGLASVGIIAARNEHEEARAIALAARDGLARNRTVGIVTPDRNLARRVVAELARFQIEVDDSAGTPLFQSPAGRLVRELLTVAVGNFAPVDVMALLNNRGAQFGLPRRTVSFLADDIDLGLLRGQRPLPGLGGLRQALAHNLDGTTEHPARKLNEKKGEAIADLLERLGQAVTPVCEIIARGSFRACELAQVLLAGFEAVTASAGDDKFTPDGTAEFRKWANDAIARDGEGPPLRVTSLDSVLYGLMAGYDVRNPQPRRQDIAIWGQLEARLQSPDLMILAGLNEDIWPQPADPGPWLSRGMRLAVGLEPPERKHGLAAHDFELAIGNVEALIAYAERIGTSPATPSRLVQRLEAFLGRQPVAELRARGAKWCHAARLLDHSGEPKPATRPYPKPAASIRPRRLSVTEVETLFRSPYDLYAKYVLRLRPMDMLGEEPGGRERGSIIHEIFSRFVTDGHDCRADDALDKLSAIAETAFAGLESIADRRDIWLKRFGVAAEAFLAFERERHLEMEQRRAEIDGEWIFPHLDGFTLTGRADRVDHRKDGKVEIIDFKTGSIPAPRDMKCFDAPQLLLEAAMARAGALAGVSPCDVHALTYVKIGLGPNAFELNEFKLADGHDLASAADEISRRMQRHVSEFLLKDVYPMTSRLRPDTAQRFRGAYDHLARAAEWTLVEAEDGA